MKDQILRGVYLFKELTAGEMDLILSIAKEKKFKKDEVVFNEGEPGDAFFIIVSGSVRISTIVPGVGEEALAVLKAGEYFGEMALIDDAPRSASAIANENSLLIYITKEDFLRLISKNNTIGYKLLWIFTRTLTDRLRKTDEQLKAIFAIAKNF
ncbi:MAG TPA: cyclic nucleotide-binding domain-containing protein [bacterium (Candidatus Stahlbacteria)]|nr:cyclic nucleotide-binding domain-containing protein [Candidatus Stahlbacteria bacterium]